MSRVWFAWVAVSLAVVGSGCTMCQSPYDYTGPVLTCGQAEPGHVRAGSILSGVQPGAPVEQVNASVPTAAPVAAEKKAELTPQAPQRSLILEQKPAQVEGRKTEQRAPNNGWKQELPSTLPQSLLPRNGN